MRLNNKVVSLINEGFKAKTLKGFSDKQINQLYERVVKSSKKKENKEETKQTVTNITYDPSNTTDQQKLAQMGVHIDPATKKVTMSTSGGKIQTEEEDLNITNDPDSTADGMGIFEKEIGESKKKKRKINPWAICTASVGREDKEKYEKCVKDVKKKNKGNLDLGEEKKLDESLFIEEKILNLVQKYVEPKMTKKELISLIERKESNAPATKPKEPTTKPGTKTPPKEKPFDPFKPSPSKQPKPKASKKEEPKESNAPATKPKEPTTKPGTKTPPKEKPFDPFKPSPSKQPNPKAKTKTNVPDWLSFNKLGIKFKK